jgi:hypothetical protein
MNAPFGALHLTHVDLDIEEFVRGRASAFINLAFNGKVHCCAVLPSEAFLYLK